MKIHLMCDGRVLQVLSVPHEIASGDTLKIDIGPLLAPRWDCPSHRIRPKEFCPRCRGATAGEAPSFGEPFPHEVERWRWDSELRRFVPTEPLAPGPSIAFWEERLKRGARPLPRWVRFRVWLSALLRKPPKRRP